MIFSDALPRHTGASNIASLCTAKANGELLRPGHRPSLLKHSVSSSSVACCATRQIAGCFTAAPPRSLQKLHNTKDGRYCLVPSFSDCSTRARFVLRAPCLVATGESAAKLFARYLEAQYQHGSLHVVNISHHIRVAQGRCITILCEDYTGLLQVFPGGLAFP